MEKAPTKITLGQILTSWPVRLVGTMLCIWLLVRNIDVPGAFKVLSHANISLVLLCTVATGFVLLFSLAEWAVLIRSSVPISWRKLSHAFLKSIAPAYLLPTGLGGDAVRIYDLCGNMKPAAATAASVIARLGSSTALMIWALIGSFEMRGPFAIWAIAASAIAVFVMVLLWIMAMFPNAAAMMLVKITKRFHSRAPLAVLRFASELKELRANPTTLAVSLAMSLLGWGVQNLCLSVLARAVGLDVGWYVFAMAVPFSLIATLAPFALNGYGLREGILVGILVQTGITPTNAAAVALLVDLQMLPFILISALMWLDKSPTSRAAAEVQNDARREIQSMTR